MSTFKLRVLVPENWAEYKLLRLSALKESPDSFGSTYEKELAFSDVEWIERLRANFNGMISLPLVAELDGNLVGLAWGVIHHSDKKVAHIYQMWVSPEARGNGIAMSFLNELKMWALSNGCTSIELEVTTNNDTAVGLYKIFGFQAEGVEKELRAGSRLLTQRMVMALDYAA